MASEGETMLARNIESFFESLNVDESWTYENLKKNQRTYFTHSYHRYPAKFIPQLVRRLILEYCNEEEWVCDPLAGGGTTLIEGLLNVRRVIGVDINPIAYLICKAKTQLIDPLRLKKSSSLLFSRLEKIDKENYMLGRIENSANYERIRFWFDRKTIIELSWILSAIGDFEEDLQLFFKCGFSHILKNCSRWHMNCIKPRRDKLKKITDPISVFKKHIEHMKKKNDAFYNSVPSKMKENYSEYVKVYCGDCREIPSKDNEVSLIVTSPPYITSYEYINLHQLSLLWLYPELDFKEIKENLIGVEHNKRILTEKLSSSIGNKIVRRLIEENGINGHAKSVLTYFSEMEEVIKEFWRVIKTGGIACIVIGNARMHNVRILNAEVLTEIALNKGFELKKVIKRRIPTSGKFLPTLRDPKTGRFISNISNKSCKRRIYPSEYILVLQKS